MGLADELYLAVVEFERVFVTGKLDFVNGAGVSADVDFVRFVTRIPGRGFVGGGGSCCSIFSS
jgi:hypothetical protein